MPDYFLLVKDGMTRPVSVAEYLAALGTTAPTENPAGGATASLVLRDGTALALRDGTALALRSTASP